MAEEEHVKSHLLEVRELKENSAGLDFSWNRFDA